MTGDSVTEVRRFKVPASYENIIYQPGRVARIIMNRPKYHNALSHVMYSEVEHAFDRAADDPEVRVIVVSGAGPNFSSGHDALGSGSSPQAAPVLDDDTPPEELIRRFPNEKELWREYWIQHHWYIAEMGDVKIEPCPKPTIAMVQGYAIYGGMGLATSMDLVFATEDPLFLPAGVGEWEKTCINWRRATEMAYEHRFLTGREAYELGLVNRVFSTFEVLEAETMAFAERVASQPLSILLNLKRSVLERRGLSGRFDFRGEVGGSGGRGVPLDLRASFNDPEARLRAEAERARMSTANQEIGRA